MSEYLKVEGHEHLVRDMGSKAIVNTNRFAYMGLQSRGQRMHKKQKMN